VQRDRPVRHQFALNLADLSHLRIELGFPLYAAPLMASIVRLGCPEGAGPCAPDGAEGKYEIAPLVSADRPGGSLLVARWLPRGRYLVALSQEALRVGANSQFEDAEDAGQGEAPPPGRDKVVCQRFSFRLMVEKVSAAGAADSHGGQHLQALPPSLNGVAFLKFGGSAHLWGRFGMRHQGCSPLLAPTCPSCPAQLSRKSDSTHCLRGCRARHRRG